MCHLRISTIPVLLNFPPKYRHILFSLLLPHLLVWCTLFLADSHGTPASSLPCRYHYSIITIHIHAHTHTQTHPTLSTRHPASAIPFLGVTPIMKGWYKGSHSGHCPFPSWWVCETRPHRALQSHPFQSMMQHHWGCRASLVGLPVNKSTQSAAPLVLFLPENPDYKCCVRPVLADSFV